MEVRCIVCGVKEEITKLHKDYRKIARSQAVFICEGCQKKMKYEANLHQNLKKPL